MTADSNSDLFSAPAGEDLRPPPDTYERLRVLDAYVDKATPAEVLARLTEYGDKRWGCWVLGMSGPNVTRMADDPSFRASQIAADLIVPDGRGFVWGARMLGVQCPDRLAIPDLCEQLLDVGARHGWKVFLYGATPELNGVACENIRTRFPGLKEVAGQHGYDQGQAEEDALIERLRNEQFNLVIVGRPSPDKELFLARCCRKAGVVGIAAGGYADILAGKTRRAPQFIQAIGMEWLFRILQEPGRLWKRVGWANARFAARVLAAHFFARPRKPLWSSLPIQVVGILLAFVAGYAQAINAPYHFDDPEYIQENPTIRSFEALKEIKVAAFRKLWWWSNAACYKLSEWYGNHLVNRPDVRIFRLWNYACHFLAALALYGLLRRCVRALRDESDGISSDGGPLSMLPAVAAMLFAAHPLATESVTYISGRDNGQGGMFYLAGLYFAAVAMERLRGPRALGRWTLWPKWFWPASISLALGACTILTKESYLTYPGAVALVYLTFYRSRAEQTVSYGVLAGLIVAFVALGWGAAGRTDGRLALGLQCALALCVAGFILGRGESGAPPKRNWRGIFRKRLPVYWGIALFFLGVGATAIAAFPYAYQRTIGALTGDMNSDYVRSLATQAWAVPQMLWRAVLPLHLSIDHDFPSISDPGDPRTLIGIGILLVLVIFGAIGVWRRWVGGFAVLLGLLTIAPTNSVIERGDIVSERNFYLVAAGGACLVAWILAELLHALAKRMATGLSQLKARAVGAETGLWTMVLGCCVVTPYVTLTVMRNDEWRDPMKMWASAREEAPEALRVLYNFGVASAMRQNYDDAEWAFETLISLGEDRSEKGLFRSDQTVQVKCFHLAYARLAELRLKRFSRGTQKDDFRPLKEVDALFKRGIKRTAFDPDLSVNYAQYLFQLRRFSEAAPILRDAFNLHPWAGQVNYPMGVAYLESDQFAAARECLMRAKDFRYEHSLGVQLDAGRSQRSEPLALLAVACLRLKDSGAAKEFLRESIDLHPRGLFLISTSIQSARNPKLKVAEEGGSDLLVQALSVLRRDLLETVRAAIREHLAGTDVRERGTMEMYARLVDSELARRDEVQKKREAFGFTDNPDKDD
jgi:N-acetylglucosaminyldiphosphoundecaprenol N-acetyl-beta-D-mannosaminyltransferase